MRTGVGYSENPDTREGGREAVKSALAQARQRAPCDFVLLFATATHDPRQLRKAVADHVGKAVPIFGGGAAGIITLDRFGYAGDQIGLAAFWLDRTTCDILVEDGLVEDEQKAGQRLGERLARLDVTEKSPVLLFYDAIHTTAGNHLRLIMATYLLEGIERGLGFLPDLVGAGLQGDHAWTATAQWTGTGISPHQAIAMAFGGDIRMDSVIVHGCRPATGYYTVTRADQQTLLEINGKPALSFLDGLLGPDISPEDYPFFLILGVNQGDKWSPFNENSYANRLCMAIDRERGGIVMFEPDMVAGTQFQIMYRTLLPDYVEPRIKRLFSGLNGRKPVFSLYINCAGRAAGYSGTDLEDAVAVQKAIAGRVPLLGIYSGVEIAAVEGRPRSLDWTGVFCLFSVPEK
ncbi:FIST C-terminal domain-containing protein [Desulfosarcina sp. OttesenSCG-928-G10]|nr:FIST C-terminal domain-containing protein [Desulfosarcina sp. OttesenSCG-928-G10]MDL2321745.1 FIST C-terminal domain-containing protein [Desulfosarcina sp. OttesenSCG-928-B08]